MQIKLNEPGEVIVGLEDLRQRIKIILETPLGSLVHNPDFGSNIFKRVDMPVNKARPFVINDAFQAIKKHEPNLEIIQIGIKEISERNISFFIRAAYLGEEIEFTT